MASARQRQLGNQERFRRANERLHERIRAVLRDERPVPFLCECADDTCMDPVHLTLDEYRRIRGRDANYLIIPGHPMIEGEDVVCENERYAVVEKRAA
jgi:hypothetical protein